MGMLWIHIAAGLSALLAGFVALYVRKGGTAHRYGGRIFASAMFVMTISAAIVAGLLRPNPGNVLAASVTFYLVATGWLAVRAAPDAARRRYLALAAFGLAVGAYGVGLATVAFQTPRQAIGGIPAVAMAIFASVVLAATVGDLRLVYRSRVNPASRLLRHLWRMGVALWIATASFFFGQADEFPQAIRQTGVLAVPVIAVAVTVLYWAVRQAVVARRAGRGRLNGTSVAAPPSAG